MRLEIKPQAGTDLGSGKIAQRIYQKQAEYQEETTEMTPAENFSH
jgi:hypothetical protein